ncbi:MAG: pyridoxal-phosphate dependent enzyme [Thermodesulfobacteriota bacterium]
MNDVVPALFEAFPQVGKRAAWISLGSFPTPVQRLRRLGHDRLWIKRDDVSADAYGGNKVRKLQFILADVRKQSKTHIVTTGAVGTHHGVATAIFGNRLGLKTSLLLFDQPITDHVKQNLLLMKKYGANLIYKKTLFRTMFAFYTVERIRYPAAYFLYPGGSNAVGTLGYVDAVFELKKQIDGGHLPKPDLIFCPLGSGGTLAGLSLGMLLSGLAISVIGVRVIHARIGPFPATTTGTVKKIMRHTYRFLKQMDAQLPEIDMKAPVILDAYLGDGYGHPTPAGRKALKLMQEKEGIILETTYTAKTFAAVLEYCQAHRTGRETVLFWNTFNSVDLTAAVSSVNYNAFPTALHKILKMETIQL